jgi:uncharacterized protein YggU (UPF0235/DUF167 family)
MFVKVKVSPGDRREEVTQLAADAWHIRVREPAANNAANRRVCTLVAERLGVPAGRVRIVRGHHGRSKILETPDPS